MSFKGCEFEHVYNVTKCPFYADVDFAHGCIEPPDHDCDLFSSSGSSLDSRQNVCIMPSPFYGTKEVGYESIWGSYGLKFEGMNSFVPIGPIVH